MRLETVKQFLKMPFLQGKQRDTHLSLTTDEMIDVVFRIERVNAVRLRLIGWTAIALELLLIIFNDIPNLSRADYSRPLALWFFWAHVFLLAISSLAVFAQRALFVEGRHGDFKRYSWVSGSFGMLFLSGVAFITGLDQLVNNQTVSFIAMFAAGTMVYYCRPPRQLFIFGIPVLVFITSVWYFQGDASIAIANIVNGLLFAVTMLVMSVFNYNRAISEISKEILLEAWTKKLDFLAHHDSLTGLYNRRRFEHEVNQLSASGNKESHFALGLMDLDNFKKVNDLFGHDRADIVLIRVAEIMKRSIEPYGFVARWGGEEFIFMLQGKTFEDLIEKVESLRIAIASEVVEIEDKSIQITGSFGMTEVVYDDFGRLNEKFTLVDTALYESKRSGRNRLTVKSS